MIKNLFLFLAGLLFSVGLFISGMTNPQKVLSFLNISGEWDPTLLWVMVGAIIPTTILYRLAWCRKKPMFENIFDLPKRSDLDRNLILGSVIFGIGWGLSGVCPGPAVANIFAGNMGFMIFVISMFLGMWLKR